MEETPATLALGRLGRGRGLFNISNLIENVLSSIYFRDKLARKGLDLLEKHIPIAGDIIGKLREYYNFPKDRAQERDVLKDIINSLVNKK